MVSNDAGLEVRPNSGPVSLAYESDLKMDLRGQINRYACVPTCGAKPRFSLQAGGFSQAGGVTHPTALRQT